MALAGQDNYGNPTLPEVIDFDSDNKISLREAHLYAVYGSESSDIPRSLSEEYLISWQPWYVRWLSYSGYDTENDYFTVAKLIAGSLGLNADDVAKAARSGEKLLAKLDSDVNSLEQELESSKSNVSKLQKNLQNSLLMQWPQLHNPYSKDYVSFIAGEGQENLASWVETSADYLKLTQEQDALKENETKLLELNRKKAKILRMKRMVTIGRLANQILRYGTKEEQTVYLTLLENEKWIPTLNKDSFGKADNLGGDIKSCSEREPAALSDEPKLNQYSL